MAPVFADFFRIRDTQSPLFSGIDPSGSSRTVLVSILFYVLLKCPISLLILCLLVLSFLSFTERGVKEFPVIIVGFSISHLNSITCPFLFFAALFLGACYPFLMN